MVAASDGSLWLWHSHFVGSVPVHQVPGSVLADAGVERFEGLSADLPAGLGVNVEVKPLPASAGDRGAGRHGEDAILESVLEMAQQRPVLWSSFDPVIAMRGRDAGLASAWITRQDYPLHEAVMAAANLGVDAVVVHGLTTLERGVSAEVALGWAQAREHGVSVWCWDVTVGRVRELAAAGVSGFCTDDVAEVAAQLTRGYSV